MENLLFQPLAGTKDNSNKSLKRAASPSQSLIEDLPDEMISEILYYLDTKDAFRTSLVSKRWLRLFYSLDFFSFHDGCVKNADNRIQLLRFVNSVLLSPHHQHLPIESFDLHFKSQLWDADDHFTINKCVEAAKRRGTRDLHLHLINVPLAPSIFCFKTLVKLSFFEISIGSLFHSCVDLPLLTNLYMFKVSFHNRQDFMKLVSGCPLLDTMNTMFIRVSNKSVTAGYYKPLSNLVLSSICLFEVPFKAVYNVQHLSILELGRTSVNVETNSYYKDFPVFQNLTILYLTWSNYANSHEWDEVLNMLHSCPKLQSLTIYKRGSPTKEDWKYPYHVPQCISSHLTTCHIERYGPLEADFLFATYILKNARHLQVMTIGVLRPNPMESSHFVDDLFSSSRISPACQLSISELQLSDLPV